MIVIPETRHGK